MVDKKGEEIVKAALEATTAEQWKAALTEDFALFECLDEAGNHNFKYAAQQVFLDELVSGQLTGHVWENFPQIYKKLLDKDDVVRAVTKKYMEQDADPLTDKYFELVSPYISKHIVGVASDDVMRRMELWLSSSPPVWTRIDWILDKLDANIRPRESLISRIKSWPKEADDTYHETLLRSRDLTFK